MKWLKVGAVVFGALIVTALGIDAADTLSGSRSTLLGQLIKSESGSCPAGMVEVPMASTFACVDIYEASPSDTCPQNDPQNELQSKENIDAVDCSADSKEGVYPWRFITREQAVTACMRAGKRLPTASEWHLTNIGTPDTEVCNTNGPSAREGGGSSCVSAIGAYDTIGNVWEWTSDDIVEGRYKDRQLPESGYITQVDADGIALLTGPQPSDLFYEDYFWSSPTGVFGMLRGGFYGSKEDAGIYSTHAQTVPTTAGTAIGFRCVL